MDVGSAAPLTGAEWIGQPQHEELRRGTRPRLPEEDPFYYPPAGFQHAAPGTVLRSRDVEVALLGVIPQRVTATQLLYRTTDMNGKPEATATTVIVPASCPLGAATPILSYQCAIDAVTSRCFPSYALRRWSLAPGALAQLEIFLIAAAVAEGWAVSVPDHEGPHGAWGTPYEPGYRILDGLRAAVDALELSEAAPIGMWGYSGGGLATAWAAEMSGAYAPELNIVGAVLGSPVADLGHAFRRLNGSFYAGLPAMVVAALSHVYPDLDRIIQEHATDQGKAMLLRVENMTTAHAVLRLIGMDMGKLIDRPLNEILDMPEVQYVFDSIKLGTAVPSPPVLVVQAVHDSIVAVEDIDELTDTYESGGASVTYHRDMFSEHILLHPMSAPMTLRWLADRFDGKALDEHLMRTKWPTLLNPMTYVGMARLLKIAAKVVTGRTVERNPL